MEKEIRNLCTGLLLAAAGRAGMAREFLLGLSECGLDLFRSLLYLPWPGGRPSLDHFHQKADQAWRKGIQACLYLDPDYPYRLRQISGFPLVLFYSGEAAVQKWNHHFAVAVAGSRQPTVYGRRVTRSLSAELAREDVLIISGLARGVEGLAHQTALDQGGLTLAVLAHGLDLVYPPEHARLLENIKRTGLIVSEHPPGTRPQRQFFPARNRILSGLADVVVITEAARSCGSQITAGFAADQGREVLAVPGPVFSQQSQGCHQLIKDGAGLLESSADIFSCRPLPATRD